MPPKVYVKSQLPITPAEGIDSQISWDLVGHKPIFWDLHSELALTLSAIKPSQHSTQNAICTSSMKGCSWTDIHNWYHNGEMGTQSKTESKSSHSYRGSETQDPIRHPSTWQTHKSHDRKSITFCWYFSEAQLYDITSF